MHRTPLSLALAAASGLLLAAAFPPLEWAWAAWVALVPLFAAVAGASRRRAAGLGLLAGAACWLPSIFWITKVTIPGWFGLALYCGAYTIPPALFAAWWTRRMGGECRTLAHLGFMAGITAVWTGFEFVRGTLFTGFAWNPLGVSQYRNLALIQHAEWGGVYAVSALVVWVNAAGFVALRRFSEWRRGLRQRSHPEIMGALFVVTLAALSGWTLMSRVPAPDDRVRLALVQPAIPQYEKWTDAFVDDMYGKLRFMSEAALRGARPDLLVWPETAVPDDLRLSEAAHALLLGLATNGAPLLVGAIDSERADDGTARYFNTSFLVGPGAAILQKYDKQHLVIFGEYVPLQEYLPWLRTLTPIQYYVSPGREPTVFTLDRPKLSFSVVICFEDTVAGLCREFVRRGARLLLTQTNDAWFDVSSGSRQHMLHCVFRCVENRVPVARCANSGVTCWIDERGRIGGAVGEGAGALPTVTSGGVPAAGFLSAEVPFRRAAGPFTFYTRFGDVFGGTMAAIGLALLIPALRRGNPKSECRSSKEVTNPKSA